MELISFEDYSRHVRKDALDPRNKHGHKQELLLDTLSESKVLEKVIASESFFYPKYLWRKDENVELYFFTKEKVIICYEGEDKKTRVSSLSLKDVLKTDVILHDAMRQDCELSLHFTNGEVLTFSSSDSNNAWKHKFYDAIIGLNEKFL